MLLYCTVLCCTVLCRMRAPCIYTVIYIVYCTYVRIILYFMRTPCISLYIYIILPEGVPNEYIYADPPSTIIGTSRYSQSYCSVATVLYHQIPECSPNSCFWLCPRVKGRMSHTTSRSTVLDLVSTFGMMILGSYNSIAARMVHSIAANTNWCFFTKLHAPHICLARACRMQARMAAIANPARRAPDMVGQRWVLHSYM